MISEAIILAGGKGTRLQSVVSDVPKPMADIDGKPFLYHQITYLIQQGISRIILSVGYKHEVLTSYFGNSFKGIEIVYVVEESPLGTGGGLRLALEASHSEHVLVCNGDTFFKFDLGKLSFVHFSKISEFTFSVRKIQNDGRYGGLKISDDCRVEEFIPKNIIAKTFINAGAYLVSKHFFLDQTRDLAHFSLEDDFLALKLSSQHIFAVPFPDTPFLDIGIPEDYFRAQHLIPEWVSQETAFIETVFLDRDGVINEKIDGGYVTQVSELKILNGVEQWLKEQSKKGRKFFVITNQRGIGRGVMSISDLQNIHDEIASVLRRGGVSIEKFYFCPDVEATSPRRKPNPGMLEDAFHDYPQLNKQTAVLIGDSLSDLQAAGKFGIKSVFLTNYKPVNFEILLHCQAIANTLQEVDP